MPNSRNMGEIVSTNQDSVEKIKLKIRHDPILSAQEEASV